MSNSVEMLGVCAGFALFFLYANLFEYVFHRWVMHHRWRGLASPYETHTLVHHEVFHGDETFQTRRTEDRDRVLFEWWQGPLMIGAHAPAIWGVQFLSGVPLFWGGIVAMVAYYVLYEYLHFCIHRPAGRRIERSRVFQYVAAHHRLHHRLWRTNFNVVFPLGDFLFGTFRPVTL